MSAAAVTATPPNPARGEASLRVDGVDYTLRPTFTALVAAEQELGSLFALVERAAEGQLSLDAVARLFWHCLTNRPGDLSPERVGQAIAEAGLARVSPVLRALLTQILQGQ